MDKPETHLAMSRSPLVCLAPMLLLLLLLRSGECRPGLTQRGPPAGAPRRAELLEAVKAGILGSLGLDREPRPERRASERELTDMFRLYRDALRDARGNSSLRSPADSSTLLFPASVNPVKAPRRPEQEVGGRLHWHRAVFHRNRNLHSNVSLARAQLRISRRILNRPPGARQEVRVRVDGVPAANASSSGDDDLTLDLSPETERWLRAGDGRRRPLVVDVGLPDSTSALGPSSLSLSLEPEPGRSRRSTKEDECDERGWCCLRSEEVSFKDIGWTEWVVAPSEYTMYFCDGACPHNYKPASMHTQVKSRLHQISKGGTPRPCCVPAAYEPMVLMHYDGRGKLKLTPFNDFIVTKCHCA